MFSRDGARHTAAQRTECLRLPQVYRLNTRVCGLGGGASGRRFHLGSSTRWGPDTRLFSKALSRAENHYANRELRVWIHLVRHQSPEPGEGVSVSTVGGKEQ